MDDEERTAWETMQAFRQARDAHLPGSKDFKSLDEEYKKAEAEYFSARKPENRASEVTPHTRTPTAPVRAQPDHST